MALTRFLVKSLTRQLCSARGYLCTHLSGYYLFKKTDQQGQLHSLLSEHILRGDLFSRFWSLYK